MAATITATASAEDAATVLESFIHDTANLPAEIQHLLEEIQARDQQLAEHRTVIHNRDLALQKFVKANGFGKEKHPKEEVWVKQVQAEFEKAARLQEEKVSLAARAGFLLDRHTRRLDQKILNLQNDGALPATDPTLPSLLHDSEANLVPSGPSATHPSSSLPGTGTHHTPAPNIPPSFSNPATAAMARMLHHNPNPPTSTSTTTTSSFPPNHHPTPANPTPTAPMQSQHTQQHPHAQPPPRAPAAAATAALAHRTHRDPSADTLKRRRLNASGTGPQTLHLPTSNLARHSSAGPIGGGGSDTPKAATPTRAGSAGPRTKKPGGAGRRIAPHQASSLRRGLVKGGGGGAKSRRAMRRALKGSEGEEESSQNDEDEDDEDELAGGGGGGGGGARVRVGMPGLPGKDGAGDEVDGEGDADGLEDDAEAYGGYDDDGDDNKLYCTCQKVSHGNMVACDNDLCEREWFHWGCVGLSSEPKGRWLCPECRKLPERLVRFAR